MRCYKPSQPYPPLPPSPLPVVEVLSPVLAHIEAGLYIYLSTVEGQDSSSLKGGVFEFAGGGEGEVGLPVGHSSPAVVVNLDLFA